MSLVNDCEQCVCDCVCWVSVGMAAGMGSPGKKIRKWVKDIFDRRAFCCFSDGFYPFEQRSGLESWQCCDHRDWGHFLPVHPG